MARRLLIAILAAWVCCAVVLVASTVRDDFQRTIGPIGSNWTVGVGTAWNIVASGTQAGPGTSGPSYMSFNAFTPATDQIAGVTVPTAGVGKYVGPAVRVAPNQAYMVLAGNIGGGASIRLFKVSGSTLTQLVDYLTAVAANDIVAISATGTSSTTLKAYLNSVQLGSNYVDSSSPYTTGVCGIGAGTSTGGTVDDFTCDDVGGGGGGGGSSGNGLLLGVGAALWHALWPFDGQGWIGVRANRAGELGTIH